MRQVSKNELISGQYVQMTWKGRKYSGFIEKINPQEWAKKTGGRFIAIDLSSDRANRIIGMPYTNRAIYYVSN